MEYRDGQVAMRGLVENWEADGKVSSFSFRTFTSTLD